MYVSSSICTHNDWNFAAFVLSLFIIILSVSSAALFIYPFVYSLDYNIIIFFHYYLFQCSDCPRVEPWSPL